MEELSSLKNIGKELARKLHRVGIDTADDLKQIGCKEAFLRLKNCFPQVCLVHLYALQGAVDDVDFNLLSDEIKSDLKVFSDQLR